MYSREGNNTVETMTSKLALLAKSAVTAAILLLLSAPAIGQTATVTTDKNHYSPGETVIITGAGWQPGETVNMVIREDPSTHLDHFLSSVADPSGTFTNTEFSPEEHDAGVTFTLTATGQSSGRTAQTTFIDAPAPHFDIASNHVATLGSHVFTALVRNVVGSSPDTARCIRVATPASVTVTGATHVVANPGATGPWTLTTGANFVELRTDTNSNTGIFGSTLGSDNWVRFEITATASSIATEEWSASMSSDNAKSGCSDSTDRLGVSVAESLPRQYTADFRDGSDNVIAAPTAAEDSTQAYRIRITRTAGTDDLSRAIVALPTCFTNVTAISMTSSGSPSFTPELSDNVFLLTTFVGTKIAANADWVQLHFTATADCSPGPHAFRTASWKNQNAETPQGDIFQLAGTGLPPLTVTSLAVCGNSVVEGSEQCDEGAANGTAGSCCSATCTFESQATVCRAGSGDLCDPAETCTGSSAACPADTFEPSTTVCNPGSGDACDPDELCPGTAGGACPADNVATADTVCNPGSGDACDPDEFCTGSPNQACPADNVAAAGTTCRAAAGVCDATEQCTGTANQACPADAKKGAETTCRGSAGVCDTAETCNGTSNACPNDAFQPATVVCRPEADGCDLGETCTGSSALCPADVLQARVFLVIDEESIDNGNPPNFFSAADVNDNIARIGLRSELPYFASHENQTITLHTGTVGDEGWFAPKTIPTKWGTVGPTPDGLRNYILAGPGLGSGGNPDRWLDKIPDVTPLRATGLNMLEGACVCALVYDSNISINYGPLNGNLKGANLGLAAFEVENVTQLTGYSSGSLPKVEIEIRDAAEVCNGPLTLLSAAPAPTSSSQPYDTVP